MSGPRLAAAERKRAGFCGGNDALGDGGGSTKEVGSNEFVLELVKRGAKIEIAGGITSVSKAGSASLPTFDGDAKIEEDRRAVPTRDLFLEPEPFPTLSWNLFEGDDLGLGADVLRSDIAFCSSTNESGVAGSFARIISTCQERFRSFRSVLSVYSTRVRLRKNKKAKAPTSSATLSFPS